MTLGKRLKEKRIEEGFTLRELERVVGVSFSGLARIERGVGEPTKASRERVERWLSTGEHSEPRPRKGDPWFVKIEQRLARIEKELGLE